MILPEKSSDVPFDECLLVMEAMPDRARQKQLRNETVPVAFNMEQKNGRKNHEREVRPW
jgi:hypothetical protein